MLDAQLGFHPQIGFSAWLTVGILKGTYIDASALVLVGVSASLGFCLSLPRCWCPSSVDICLHLSQVICILVPFLLLLLAGQVSGFWMILVLMHWSPQFSPCLSPHCYLGWGILALMCSWPKLIVTFFFSLLHMTVMLCSMLAHSVCLSSIKRL